MIHNKLSELGQRRKLVLVFAQCHQRIVSLVIAHEKIRLIVLCLEKSGELVRIFLSQRIEMAYVIERRE